MQLNRQLAVLLALVVSLLASSLTLAEISGTIETPTVELHDLNLVGRSIQEILLKLPPPVSVYLAGEDAELPRPRVTDPVVFRYEVKLAIGTLRPAHLVVTFDELSYQAVSLCADVKGTVPSSELTDALPGATFRRERRRTESDDIDLWITEELDPEGDAEVLVFPDLGLEVRHIDDMPYTVLCFH